MTHCSTDARQSPLWSEQLSTYQVAFGVVLQTKKISTLSLKQEYATHLRDLLARKGTKLLGCHICSTRVVGRQLEDDVVVHLSALKASARD